MSPMLPVIDVTCDYWRCLEGRTYDTNASCMVCGAQAAVRATVGHGHPRVTCLHDGTWEPRQPDCFERRRQQALAASKQEGRTRA